ncbi:small subunit ribosomal protein S6e [Pancytospora epiphaga]|nr:small subunit ribosomal protein S6e [Pancytospora epiphaga]
MKILVYYPTNGTNKTIEVSAKDEQKIYGKEIGMQFDGELICEELAGCVVEIRGGNDYQGICMVPGSKTTKRVRLLLAKGDVGYRGRKSYIKKRKTVRGSIVSNNIQVISIVVVRIPEGKEIVGLTDRIMDKSHFPKRIEKISALFNIPEGEDVNAYVAKLYAEHNPDAKVPRFKVTGVVTEEEKQKRAQKLAERKARKEKFLKEKSDYESKYGVTA